MVDNTFIKQVVREILSGVQDGLTKFSGPSRVAVIYRISADEELCVCDPHHLLRGHESKIGNAFFDRDSRPRPPASHLTNTCYSMIRAVAGLDLDGVVSYGGQSGPVMYQMWFTDHHPDLLSTGPTLRWLEHTALRFSHDVANEKDLYSGISGMFLSEYATHAVAHHIRHESERCAHPPERFAVYPILQAILGISKTREERKSPYGKLIFISPEHIESIDFLARFQEAEQPPLENYKHVRKLLLSVQKFRNSLVSDGTQILGVAGGRIEPFRLTADYRGLFGFLRVNDQRICSFADGAYSSVTHQAKLFQVEEALLDYDLDSSVRSSMFHIVATIVHYAETEHFGCTIVVDLNYELSEIAGQNLERPLDLERSNMLDLACDLARVDGALQIGTDLHLHRFACLLDGPAIAAEDRARGARYNSALRFTAKNPHTIIIVVSSDRPVSVIRYGMEYGNSFAARVCHYDTVIEPQSLLSWLQEA